MTEQEYVKRLNQYHKVFLRQSEILHGYHLRDLALANEVSRLKRKIGLLKVEISNLQNNRQLL